MADENRAPPHLVDLLEQLHREPFGFDFYQAVRLLDCAHTKPQTGFSTTLKDDPIRIAQEPSAAFAAATLADIESADPTQPPRLVQRFLGLLGPQGPLPIHLTDYAQHRIQRYKDPTFSRFLDVFHHRMLAFFYRAWARVRPTVNFDRGSTDRFGEYVESLFGLGMQSLVKRDELPDLPKRHFAGLMSCQTKHAEGLLAMLRGYFRLPVEIEQFVGQWIDLPAECQCRMGMLGSSSELGKTITVGAQVWDCQQKFRIVMGPLKLADFVRLLPGAEASQEQTGGGTSRNSDELPRSASLKSLVALVRGYVGDELQWDLQLILKREETPSVSLGAQGQLGWSTWSFRDKMDQDPDDLILDPLSVYQEEERTRRRQKKSSGRLPPIADRPSQTSGVPPIAVRAVLPEGEIAETASGGEGRSS